MEPDEDICRCLPVSDGTNNHNEILTNHLFTKVFDFLFDGQSNKKIYNFLWDKREKLRLFCLFLLV